MCISLWLVGGGGGSPFNFDFPGGGSCLNCSNRIIKKNPRLLRSVVFY